MKIGRNDTVMTSRLKNSAPTSLAASTRICSLGFPGSARSICLWAFSIMTMAASIIAPTAIAIPPRLMMFAPRPMYFIAANAIKMPTGKHQDGDKRTPQVQRNTTQTSATMMLSSMSVLLSVSIAALINCGTVVDGYDLGAVRQARSYIR